MWVVICEYRLFRDKFYAINRTAKIFKIVVAIHCTFKSQRPFSSKPEQPNGQSKHADL